MLVSHAWPVFLCIEIIGLHFSHSIDSWLSIQAELNDINRRLMSGDFESATGEGDEDRSPSPEPEYDAMGKRTNTREIRVRAKLQDRR